MDSNTSTTLTYASVIARWALVAGGSWLVQHGYLTSEMVPETVGAGMALFALAWSGWTHHKAAGKLQDTKDDLKDTKAALKEAKK